MKNKFIGDRLLKATLSYPPLSINIEYLDEVTKIQENMISKKKPILLGSEDIEHSIEIPVDPKHLGRELADEIIREGI